MIIFLSGACSSSSIVHFCDTVLAYVCIVVSIVSHFSNYIFTHLIIKCKTSILKYTNFMLKKKELNFLLILDFLFLFIYLSNFLTFIYFIYYFIFYSAPVAIRPCMYMNYIRLVGLSKTT